MNTYHLVLPVKFSVKPYAITFETNWFLLERLSNKYFKKIPQRITIKVLKQPEAAKFVFLNNLSKTKY